MYSTCLTAARSPCEMECLRGQCLKRNSRAVCLFVIMDHTVIWRTLSRRTLLLSCGAVTAWSLNKPAQHGFYVRYPVAVLVTEYCCPMWSTSRHIVSLLRPHKSMGLISLQPIRVLWLACLANMALRVCTENCQPTLWCIVSSPSKLSCVCCCLWSFSSMDCTTMSGMVRHDTCSCNCRTQWKTRYRHLQSTKPL